MIRTLGRMMFLSAVAIVVLHGSASAEEENSLGRIPEFQKLLNEPISFEIAIDTTLDKALDELLTRYKIPWSVNEIPFGPDNKDVVKKTPVEKFEKLSGMTRATLLKKLLAQIPNDGEKTNPTYVLRPDHLEITTHEGVMREFYPGRRDAHLPELTYAVFNQATLRQALAELARTTESTVVLDPKVTEDAKTAKVSVEFRGVPADTAVQVLADMAGLKLVRLENVYYVTAPGNAELLRKEANKRRVEQDKVAAENDGLIFPIIP